MTSRDSSEEEVARMLAAEGGASPMPPHVAERLDGVLADLVAERTAAFHAPPSGARRRQRWPRVVLAAAAVVVAGYGVGTVVQGTGDAGQSAEDASAGGGVVEPPGSAGSGAGSGAESAPGALAGRRLRGVAELRSGRLEQDVRAALGAADLDRGDPTLGAAGCAPPALEQDQQWLPARYDERRAVLVVEDRSKDVAEVTVYSCAGRALDSARVTLR